MSTMHEALTTTLARRDADELAAAPEHAKALDGSCIQPCPRCLSDELDEFCSKLGDSLLRERDLRADLATAAEVTARLTEERDHAIAQRDSGHRLYESICNALEPLIPASTRRLEWDVLPSMMREIAAERDTLRASLDRCQTKLGEVLINDERDALRAQRNAAVEALQRIARAKLASELPWQAQQADVRGDSDACDELIRIARAALLLARGTP